MGKDTGFLLRGRYLHRSSEFFAGARAPAFGLIRNRPKYILPARKPFSQKYKAPFSPEEFNVRYISKILLVKSK
jgi:hypothetical protein